MKLESLERANIIQEKISDLTKAVKWLSSGGDISIMANKQITTSVEVSENIKNLLIKEFQKEIEELKDEFEKM